MSQPVDYERVEHIVSDSTAQMRRLIQEAYRVGFLDGSEYQRRELVNMYQRSVADYTHQVEAHQDQLTKALDTSPQQQQAPSHPNDSRRNDNPPVDSRPSVDPVMSDPVVRIQGR